MADPAPTLTVHVYEPALWTAQQQCATARDRLSSLKTQYETDLASLLSSWADPGAQSFHDLYFQSGGVGSYLKAVIDSIDRLSTQFGAAASEYSRADATGRFVPGATTLSFP